MRTKRLILLAGLPVVGFGLWSFRHLTAQDGQPLLDRFRQVDVSADQRITPSELTDATLFGKLDADGSGEVTLEEARAAYRSGVLTREMIEGSSAPKPTPDPGPQPQSSLATASLKQTAKKLRPADHGVGQLMPDYPFRDLKGNEHHLRGFEQADAVVISMTSTSCPLSRKYLPTLADLSKEFAGRKVQFIAVNCIPTDRPEDQQKAAAELDASALYVNDDQEALARHLGAVSTTDVLVLDRSGVVVYHGAIDDQYGIGYSLDAPKQTLLKDALTAVLEGKPVAIAATKAPGCVLDLEPREVEQNSITWHNRVSRIVIQNCLECHREGGVGPFSLATREEVIAHAAMIQQVVDNRTMPPWFAAPSADGHSVWGNDRSLADADRHDLLTWLAGDRPEGDPADTAKLPEFAGEWSLGQPDYIVQIPKPIPIKASGTMPYQFVVAETDLPEDRWIQGYEILPTDRSVVHHVIVNVHEPGAGRIFDREEGVGGYWAAYVPGNPGQIYPEGFARKLPAGARISFQIHYTPSGTATNEQLRIGLHFAKKDPQYVVTTIPLADRDLNIPPHASDHVESLTRPVPTDVPVLAYMAHMHMRGKSFRFDVETPDGKKETLLDIPRYDFNWQLRYDYAEPKIIPKGSRFTVTAVFDNSAENPANPDPNKTVHWGQQTFEEMMIGYVETYVPVGESNRTRRNMAAAGAADALFETLDADGDGLLSKEEAQKAADRAPRLKDRPELLERLFDRMDSDGDGKLSKDDFGKLREQLGRKQ